MNRKLATALAAAALAATLGAPLSAQDAALSGVVAEVFGRQIVLATPAGRVLVTLPEGVEVPAPGTRLSVEGAGTDATFTATALSVVDAGDPAEALLPPALRGLGLSEIRTRPDDDDLYIYARLPDGGWLRAEARGDRLREVQTDGAALPAALVDALLPEAARAEPRLAAMRLTEIDLDDDDGDISVDGYAEGGLRIEMEFTAAGALRDYELERDDRRSLTEAAARERLAALGYTGIGFIDRGGRDVTAIAVNPFGDTVEVRLDEQGRVARERLWQN